MTDCRLDRDVLEIFSRGGLAATEALRGELHLRSGCAACQRRIDEVVRSLLRVAGFADVADIGDIDMAAVEDAAWERVLAGLERRLALWRWSAARRRRWSPSSSPSTGGAGGGGARRAVLQPRGLRAADRESFEEDFRTRRGRSIWPASRSPWSTASTPAGYAARWCRTCGRAHGRTSATRAARLRPRRAEQALLHAESLLAEGSADPLEEARVLDLKASLLSDQGWFERAAEVLEEVIEITRNRGSHRGGGR